MLDMSRTLTGKALLTNTIGLHARPSVKLTQLAKKFQSRVELALSEAGPWIDAKSPVKVMRARAPKGSVIYFRVSGPDDEAALAAIMALIDGKFGEK
jgi:phosphocarrier protein HPr